MDVLVVTLRRCPLSSRYKRPLRSQRCCIDRRCHSFSAQGSLSTYWLRCHSKIPMLYTLQKTVEISHIQFMGRVVDVPMAAHSHVLSVQRVQKTVEVTQSHSAPTLPQACGA